MKTIVTALVLTSAITHAGAQATFHGGVTRAGVYEGGGPASTPALVWKFKTGGPVVGSAAVDGGVVYVTSLDTYLYAIDQETGKEKWKFKSRMPIASSPAVSSGTLYFVSGTGALAAIDVATGQPKWVFVAEHERKFEAKNLHGYPSTAQTIPDAWDIFTSSPAVVNGKVYFGSGDGNVYAVDAATGILQWKYATRDVVHASPAVANGVVYVGSWDSTLYALDAENGQLKWTFDAGQDPAIHNQVGFQSSPAVVDGTVYVGCRDAHVYALDAGTGKKKWDYPTSKSWVIGTPAVRDGVVYVGTSDSARFLALDAKTGRLKFNFKAKAYVFSSAAISGGLVYFGNHAGRLFAVDAKTGDAAWEFQTDASKVDPMKVVNDDGTLRQEAFTPLFNDFEDMYLDIYRFASVGAIMSSPVVDHGAIYVGSMDGNVYALK
ncbi:MAG TPA: PQQ-binding-like beta-propeller repeat protein [Candidatus Polarisedimenticolaceae bacterium]|nr:PQQ-binding-like beta-propeller repeat protein [Candidatus Polarisedimenticolaceae bacterium]